jgi:hypothetical protein
MHIVIGQLSWSDLLAALLVGLILAFFVEPLIEWARDLTHGVRHQRNHGERHNSALFRAGLGLAFALVSICVHDAITAFVSGRGTGSLEHHDALAAGISLTVAWAIGPFAVTLAWLSAQRLWLGVPLAIVAAGSPWIAGWFFSWSIRAVITTTIPGLLILGFGYRPVMRGDLSHCVGVVAGIALTWLAFALIFDQVVQLFHAHELTFYDSSRFWIDVRFYLGWMLGLMLAPTAYRNASRATK